MRKAIAFILVLLFVIQMVPANLKYSYAASGDDIGNKLSVYSTSGVVSPPGIGDTPALNISPALSSFIEITSGGAVLAPNSGGNYEDIPSGADIELQYAFALSDGIEDEAEVYNYLAGEYFSIPLPSGVNFGTTSGSLEKGATGVDIATWEITGGALVVTLAIGAEGQSEIWGLLNIKGSFKDLDPGQSTQTEVIFGSQTVTIGRVPLDSNSKINKSGTYNASTNAITWTVILTPPVADPGLSYEGYIVEDSFSLNQTYVADSFEVKNGSAAAVSILDSNPALTTSASVTSTTITYTFPAGTTSVQAITYKTNPTSFAGINGESTFTNEVVLTSLGAIVGGPNIAEVDLDWIDKSGGAALVTDPLDVVKWTITVKVPGVLGGSISGASIVDQLGSDFELVEDLAHPVIIDFGTTTGTATSIASVNYGHYIYPTGGALDELIYYFPDSYQLQSGSNATLTFYTKVKDSRRETFYNNNDRINFSNDATLKWDDTSGTISGSGFPSTSATTTGVGPGLGIDSGGLILKAAGAREDYQYLVTDTINWDITVNRNLIEMTNAAIKDTIPTNQALLINDANPFVVSGGGVEIFRTTDPAITSSSGVGWYFACTYGGLGVVDEFSFTFPTPITSMYSVTYSTQVVDRADLYTANNNNRIVFFKNNVTLTRGGNADVTIVSSKKFNSQMLNKSIITNYDYKEHLAQWKIVVNRNELPITNAAVTDTLPSGMTLYISGSAIFDVTTAGLTTGLTNNAIHGGTTFTVTMPAFTTSQYAIEFWTKLDDSVLQDQWDGSKAFANKAELTSDSETIKAYATSNIINPVIDKGGERGSVSNGGNSDTIYWSIVINNAQMNLSGASIIDTFPTNVSLLEDTITLHAIGIGSDGLYDPSMPSSSAVLSYTTGSATNLTVYLPNGTDAYLLQFSTIITDGAIVGDIVNTAVLTGSGVTPGGSTTSNGISVDSLYTIAGSGTNTLTVHKTDVTSTSALSGASFTLLNKFDVAVKRADGTVITAITNASGVATFSNLPSWSFKVKETIPPWGYLISSTAITNVGSISTTTEVAITNEIGVKDISITKKGANGALLSGGEFLLSGRDFNSSPVAITATAVNGIVKFAGVNLQEKGTVYVIRETTPPAGHWITTTTLSATLAYNSAKTAFNATVSPTGNLVNIPYSTDVSFTKEGISGTAISGGLFTLSGTNSSNVLVNITSTAVNGIVTFSGVLPHKAGFPYTITETDPPNGYLRLVTPTILTVDVDYVPGHATLDVTIAAIGAPGVAVTSYGNTKALGDISFLKLKASDSTSLAGATFQLTGKDYAGNDVSMYATSSTSGIVTFKDVPIDDGNEYTIRETSPPSGYKLSATQLTATVRYGVPNGSTSAATTMAATYVSPTSISNEIAPAGTVYANIKVIKTDDKGIKLAGAEFKLYNTTRGISKTATSDSNGLVNFGTFPVAAGYTIQEIKAPAGYILNSTTNTFYLTSSGKEITFVNTKASNEFGSISIFKKDDKGLALGDAEFTLYFPGGATKTLVTKSNGTAVFTDLPVGNYTVKETQAPLGYIAVGGEVNVVVTSNASLSLNFENKKDEATTLAGVTGKLLLAKVDKDKNPLAGAVFTLYGSGGVVIAKAMSGGDGMAEFDGLAPGSYTVKETVAPDGYKLFSGSKAVVIGKDGGTLSYTLINVKEKEEDADINNNEGNNNDDEFGIAGWEDDDFALPKTGGIDWNFHLTLIGLCLLLLGLLLARPRRRTKATNNK